MTLTDEQIEKAAKAMARRFNAYHFDRGDGAAPFMGTTRNATAIRDGRSAKPADKR